MPRFQCRGRGFNPWELDPTCLVAKKTKHVSISKVFILITCWVDNILALLGFIKCININVTCFFLYFLLWLLETLKSRLWLGCLWRDFGFHWRIGRAAAQVSGRSPRMPSLS